MMRDQYRQPPISDPYAVAKMPLDKQNHITPAKPFTPTLSSAFRSSKGPLTPKLAGSTTCDTSTTPRRARLGEFTTSPNAVSSQGIASPLSAFINSNITPRSGSRKSRLDSAPSTPVGTPESTPAPSRPASSIATKGHSLENGGGSGLGISSVETKRSAVPRPRSVISEANGSILEGKPSSSYGSNSDREVVSPAAAPMFFHADDAKSSASGREDNEKPKLRAKAATIFYANGATDEAASPQTSQDDTQNDRPAKFFHTNGSPDIRSPPIRSIAATRPPATASSPSLGSPYPNRKPNIHPRPLSPLKPHQKPSDLHKSNSTGQKGTIDSTEVRKEREQPPGPVLVDQARRGSIGSTTQPRIHTKSASIASPQSTPRKSSLILSPKTSPVRFTADTVSNVLNAPLTASPEPSTRAIRLDSSNTVESTSPPSKTPSPTKEPDTQSTTKIQQMNDLATNARRERKVLDLEISNSSLLAINRTLEREMRKQNAELRRFRRLSRSGRLSSVAASSIRSVSGRSGLGVLNESEDEGNSSEHSPLQSLADDFSDSEDTDENESSLADDSILSPTVQAERDLRHRLHDEKRLRLDLQKHQQLLIDSQKMNQSIKRCLHWTEELINEGKKALEYHVRVSDVEIGGRVLAPDEVEEEREERRGLLSPSATMTDMEVVRMWDKASGMNPDEEDRNNEGGGSGERLEEQRRSSSESITAEGNRSATGMISKASGELGET